MLKYASVDVHFSKVYKKFLECNTEFFSFFMLYMSTLYIS